MEGGGRVDDPDTMFEGAEDDVRRAKEIKTEIERCQQAIQEFTDEVNTVSRIQVCLFFNDIV